MVFDARLREWLARCWIAASGCYSGNDMEFSIETMDRHINTCQLSTVVLILLCS